MKRVHVARSLGSVKYVEVNGADKRLFLGDQTYRRSPTDA